MKQEQLKSLQEEQLRKIWDNGRFAEANTGDLQNPKYNDNVEKMWKVFQESPIYLSVASQFQRQEAEKPQYCICGYNHYNCECFKYCEDCGGEIQPHQRKFPSPPETK